MKYYPFHIGDYRSATAHLTNGEDLAYRRALDWYYDTEKPIPLDTQWVSRRLRVDIKDLETVLADFFERTDEGWVHARCDREIAAYQKMAAKNRANGLKGGRQKAVAKPQIEEKNPVGFQSEPTGKLTNNQEPRTNNLFTTPSGLSSEPPPAAPGSDPPGQLLDPPQRLGGPPERDSDASVREPQPAQVLRLPQRRIPCPHERLLEAFHAECPTLPRVLKLNDRRRQHLSARWREVDADAKLASQDDGVELFRAIFRKVHESDFLSGRSKRWQASFDWLIESSTHFLRVCEGHYDNGRMEDRRAAR